MDTQLQNKGDGTLFPPPISDSTESLRDPASPDSSTSSAISSLSLGDSIFNSISDAILVIDRSGRIERVNPATLELTGFAENELVGRGVDVLVRIRKSFQRIFAQNIGNRMVSTRLEMFCKRKDGSHFPVSVSMSMIFESGAHKLVCVARDITRRKRLEAESRAISRIIHGVTTTANLDELLQLIHRTIKKIVYAENFFVALYDPQTEMLTMQFFVDKYDPMPPPLKVGRSLSAYVFRQGRSMLFTDADAKKLFESGEVELVGTNSPIWLGVPLKTPSGPIGILVVQDYENSDTYTERDVELLTSVADQIAIAIERKRNEEALRLSQERFELVTRATSDAIWDWNLETNEIWWNEGFQKLFGYRQDEVGSDIASWEMRLHPDDAARVMRDINEHITSGKTNWADEYRFRRADGTYAFVIDRGYVVYDSEGRPKRMLGSMMDVTDRKNLEQQLTYQALHDPLTKLANRALFRNRVEHAIAKLPRINTSLAVLFLDLDNFKAINDSMGHAAGDKLLVAVAERIQDCLRNTDTAARLGGDEFAVLIESVHRKDEAIVIAERIMNVFHQPFLIDGKEVYVRTSIGIAIACDDTIPGEVLLRNADVAMYRAKMQGKGNYVLFEPHMHDALMQRMELEADLRHAIYEREFVIHYQPILHLDSGKLIGMEALVRWQHPKFGLLPPMSFIPLAEETNLIAPLGEWILTEACKQMESWRRQFAFDDELSVTVNISIRQFQQRELTELVKSALEKTGLPPDRLILEITESFMMQDKESTIRKLTELKQLGIRLAIDDFGTGYSSLSYLERFPVDILKIDKTFIEKISSNGEGTAVARAIIMMGDSLKLKTIAEGIEHPEQIDALKKLGCEAGQGFHFARPLTEAAMEEFLKKLVEKP